MPTEVIFLFILLGIVAMVAAMVVVFKNIRANIKIPEETVSATLKGVRSQIKQVNQNYSSETVDSAGGEVKQYFADFKLKGGKKLTFRINRKKALSYHDGEVGQLTYKGNKFIDFTVTEKEKKLPLKDLFFLQEKKTGETVDFYGEAEQLNLSVPSDQRLKCDYSDIKRLTERLLEDQSDWFFLLKSKEKELQIEKEKEDFYKSTLRMGKTEKVQTKRMHELSDEILEFFKTI